MSRELTVAAYATVAGLLGLLELAAVLRLGGWPTLGRVLTWALRRRSTQLGFVLVWWWLGWHFVTAR